MPNFLTYRPSAPAVDELARDYGFDSDNDFIEYLLNYKPRGPLRDSIFERLAAEYSTGAEDVPF